MIAMSGSPFSPTALDDKPKETTKKIADKNGCPSSPTVEFIKCMREIPAEKLILSDSEIEVWIIFNNKKTKTPSNE